MWRHFRAVRSEEPRSGVLVGVSGKDEMQRASHARLHCSPMGRDHPTWHRRLRREMVPTMTFAPWEGSTEKPLRLHRILSFGAAQDNKPHFNLLRLRSSLGEGVCGDHSSPKRPHQAIIQKSVQPFAQPPTLKSCFVVISRKTRQRKHFCIAFLAPTMQK